jgi:hypothetical protein
MGGRRGESVSLCEAIMGGQGGNKHLYAIFTVPYSHFNTVHSAE